MLSFESGFAEIDFKMNSKDSDKDGGSNPSVGPFGEKEDPEIEYIDEDRSELTNWEETKEKIDNRSNGGDVQSTEKSKKATEKIGIQRDVETKGEKEDANDGGLKDHPKTDEETTTEKKTIRQRDVEAIAVVDVVKLF